MHLGATDDITTLKQGGASDEDLGLIDKFKKRVAEFNSVFNAFISAGPPKNPALQQEYSSLVARGHSIKTTIDTVTNSINKAVTWVKATFGLNAINQGQLGWFWLIPVAGITGALTLIGKWIADAYMFNEKNEEFKRLESKGLTPQAAAEVIRKTYNESSSGFNIVGSLGLPVLILGATWYLLNRKPGG